MLAGIAIGVWFSQNYRIVPVAPPAAAPQTASAPSNGGTQSPALNLQPSNAVEQQTLLLGDDPPPAPPTVDYGPFAYRFNTGDTLRYRLDAEVQGTGAESIGSSLIDMELRSEMTLATQSVDTSGNGALQMTFGSVDMGGNFMGGPIELHKTPERTVMRMANVSLDTDRGDSTAGIPQLEFFDTPIDMIVSPTGQVLKLSGSPGMDQMLVTSAVVQSFEWPSQEMPVGYQWQSRINLPVPGLNSAAPAVVTNTIVGYENLNGHQCAVVDQIFEAIQDDGGITSPDSIMGEGMSFSMPRFQVDGDNRIYFDTQTGTLVS
ncbi:MAG: hypothetical protein K8F32_13720, partial [Rhodocyclaceae bacterium]|nr:hypothetical protein [Rhodocyclaceae bacterium]